MVGLLYIVFLLLCYKLQKNICSDKILIKKLIIPSLFFVLSIVGCIYINDSINHSNNLTGYSNDKNAIISQTQNSETYNSYSISKDAKEIATVTISRKVLSLSDFALIMLILNIPTLSFIIFIFTGNKSKSITTTS
jgi:hypothetical protein